MFLRRRGLLGNLSQSEEPGSPPAPEGRNNKLKNGKRLYKPKYIVGKLLESRSCMFVLCGALAMQAGLQVSLDCYAANETWSNWKEKGQC